MSNVVAAALVGGFTLVAALAGVSIPMWRDHRARKAQLDAELARQRAEWSNQRRAQRDDVTRDRLLALIEATTPRTTHSHAIRLACPGQRRQGRRLGAMSSASRSSGGCMS
ncbi:hypothetical protein BH23ACT10_BH23ACT10_23020 [soil metagenome]